MRELLFRGKRTFDSKWVYGGFTLDAIERPRITERKGDGLVFHTVIPETVGQYTGLKDKNEVKIFEGDIIVYKGLRMGVKVVKEYSCFSIDDKFWMSGYKEFEVIGNIHDNLEIMDK
jgi:uncharacterized phage protein (TIGR01671 family)